MINHCSYCGIETKIKESDIDKKCPACGVGLIRYNIKK